MSASLDERVTDEVEALEAILMDDVVIKREDNVPTFIETVVHPSTGDDVDQQFVCVTLEVRLVPGYPECSPEVTLRNPRGLDEELITTINSQIRNKLNDCLGQPVIFELIELIRDNLTRSNLPSGQCAICLYGFAEGDVFTKTQCYHHFHSHCLASHVIAGTKYYYEELEKLPHWQQIEEPPFQETCPVCRSFISCDVETLRNAPPPVDSINAPPFSLTPDILGLQMRMAALLSRQIARGGVVGLGDTGPPPLTITSPADNEEAANSATSSQATKTEAMGNGSHHGGTSNDNSSPGSPSARPAYRGPYRGFKRGKPGRRGRDACGSR